MMNELNYSKSVSAKHIKDLGQYFTNEAITDFMCAWACQDAQSMLDPAVGNSNFLLSAKKHSPNCTLTGYEIDKSILDYFGNPANADIYNTDYLLSDWDSKYDAIVCNPPYNRFQSVPNRNEILDKIQIHTGEKYTSYTNLYILFLVKSIEQLSNRGKLAYLIPTEFMNSKYGIKIKQLLIERHLLRAVINFENNNDIFINAITTCCIILLDKLPKNYVDFYNLTSIEALNDIDIYKETGLSIRIGYETLMREEKWRKFINQENIQNYNNLIDLYNICNVNRGIATGANEYFCFSKSRAIEYHIPNECLTKCICHSSDVKKNVFTEDDLQKLYREDKTVLLLDINANNAQLIPEYIKYGINLGIDKKYLPSTRKPWFSMEQKQAAPIWVSSACRENIKFIRNLANTKSLTTFHSVFVNIFYQQYTDIIFCYFVTPIAQKILLQNRKEMGNGLNKFQPGDINSAKMLDISILSDSDITKIQTIYNQMCKKESKECIEELDSIFSTYLF